MFRSAFLSPPSNCIISSISIPPTPRHRHHFPSPPASILPLPPPPTPIFKPHSPPHRPRPIACAAANRDGDNDDIDQVREDKRKPSSDDGNSKSKKNGGGGGGDLGEEGGGSGRRPPFLSNVNWVSLLLDPDPDNVVAVGLTGLLTWASVSVLWQLFTISLAILVAALKYSFIAALLIFILITLL
ncbi:unnamed protein product [Linum trigynum]|uniref:Transmembrane protein n=1 Tax=Linum trigynum TaxID=586398 RepID=A0AAV2ELP4_9ROSI